MDILYLLTVLVLLFSIVGAVRLSKYNSKKGNICPKPGGVPACYIVLVFFLATGVSHLLNTTLSNKLYFLFISIPGFIALVGTVTELTGKKICPRTESGIPMCYISLGLCGSLAILKYFSL